MRVPGEKGWPEEMTRQSQGDTRIFQGGWWDSGSGRTDWSREPSEGTRTTGRERSSEQMRPAGNAR